MSKEITQDEFEEEVEEGLVMVDCYSDTCVPCKNVKQILPELEKQFPELKILTINVYENIDVAQEIGIKSVPTFAFYKDGELEYKYSGFNGKDDLVEKICYFMDKN